MDVSVTGHRPDKIIIAGENAYSPAVFNKFTDFCTASLKAVRNKIEIDRVLTGMALGFDCAVAISCIKLNIPFIACIPFKGQELKWTQLWQDVYKRILDKAKRIKIVSPGGYAAEKMHYRNEYLIDHSEYILTFYNGDKYGGTYSCLKYAKFLNKPMCNIYDNWLKYKHVIN